MEDLVLHADDASLDFVHLTDVLVPFNFQLLDYILHRFFPVVPGNDCVGASGWYVSLLVRLWLGGRRRRYQPPAEQGDVIGGGRRGVASFRRGGPVWVRVAEGHVGPWRLMVQLIAPRLDAAAAAATVLMTVHPRGGEPPCVYVPVTTVSKWTPMAQDSATVLTFCSSVACIVHTEAILCFERYIPSSLWDVPTVGLHHVQELHVYLFLRSRKSVCYDTG